MQTLKLDDKTARKIYPNSIPEFKAVLEESFPKGFFSQKPIDRIKTFEDACEDQGIDRYNILPYKIHGSEFEEAINGFAQMCIIAKSLNGDWVADLNNTNQPKYYPWFKRSGSALSCDGYDVWSAITTCGVRLAYRDAETAEYAGRQFLAIYNKFI